MQASTNKRKGENVITQNARPTETKLLRQAHTRKNKKLRETYVSIEGSSPNTTNKRLWVAFGQWLGLKGQDGPLKRKHIRQHLSDRDFQDLFDIATAFNTRREKASEPECITDLSGRTLVHLEQLDDYNTIILATNTVNNYYFHTLEHLSHRSNEFWTNFIEHFRAYTRNNLLPFTSSNTASTHNIDHHEYINKLLQDLKALSDCQPPFGVFPMIAINFNTTSDYYWDEHDEANSLCVLVALGDYEEGELCFPQLQMVIHLRPEQIIVFASRLLLYAYIKAGIKKGANRPMVSEQDLNNAQGLNHQTHLPKPKAKQIQVSSAVSDRRREYIDLVRARQGLKTEDPLPDL
ncbi:19358_t:CDS:2, partial [Racocetra persica]